nr:PEP-CTERM sorting domain-containing protein [Acidobacteriota bacterium]
SPNSVGGFLTADAFNLLDANGTLIDVTAFATTNSYFRLFEDGPFATPPPGGDSRTTLISGADGFTGSGSPTGGIGVGGSATFSLTLATDLTAATFAAFFGSEEIRFRGLANGGSDKVSITTNPPTSVPEPASLLLLGLGLAAVARSSKKRL